MNEEEVCKYHTSTTVVTEMSKEGLLHKLRESLRRDLAEIQAGCASSVDTELVWPRTDFEQSLAGSIVLNQHSPKCRSEKRFEESERNLVEEPLLPLLADQTPSPSPLLRHANLILQAFEELDDACPETSINHGPARKRSIHVLQEMRGLLVELHPALMSKPTTGLESAENPDVRRILLVVAALHNPESFSPILDVLQAELQRRSSDPHLAGTPQPSDAGPTQILSRRSQIIIGPKGVEFNIVLQALLHCSCFNSASTAESPSIGDAPRFLVEVKLHWFEPITQNSSWSVASTQAWLSSYLPGQPNESSNDALFQLHLELATSHEGCAECAE